MLRNSGQKAADTDMVIDLPEGAVVLITAADGHVEPVTGALTVKISLPK